MICASTSSSSSRVGPRLALLLLLSACCLISSTAALVELPDTEVAELMAGVQLPVTNWLMSSDVPVLQKLVWRKIGAKLWLFLSTMDHDFVDAEGHTVPPNLSTKRVFGPSVTCGRFARQWIRMPFHDCGTYDVGNTGTEGSRFRPRFGCNGSLRKEIAPCLSKGPECINGVEARYDLATGKYLPETVFEGLEKQYGKAAVDWGFDTLVPRMENSGMAQSMAFFYQIKFEAQQSRGVTRMDPSIADVMMYAGMLAVAKCGGPQIEFQPGRVDSLVADAPMRLPNPVAPLAHTISYFWSNGLTNFDMVNLLSAHSTSCFSVGCLDSTPNKLDAEWAKVLLDINAETDPHICQFPRDVTNSSMPTPVLHCAMPADVEINARPDFAPYLRALTGAEPVAAAAARAEAQPSCPQQAGVPSTGASCDAQRGIPAFVPFRILTLRRGSVNLCNRPGAVGCPADARTPYQDAFATSYFKMSKMYAVRGVNQGTEYGVQTQPCQPGLIKVGEIIPPSNPEEIIPPMNPNERCSCCPNPPPQRFYFARLPNLRRPSSKPHAEVEVVSEGAPIATQALSYAGGWAWYAANIA